MSNKINDGGPAFPVDFNLLGEGDDVFNATKGMTLRDWFAGMAVGPLVASDGFEKIVFEERKIKIEDLPRFTAETAYQIADAMIAEREKGKPSGEANTPS